MITVGMNYAVLEGKEEVFERAFEQVIGALNEAPGHTQSWLYQEVGKPNAYLIVSDWNDEGAFNEFIRSDEFRKVTNWGAEQILAGRPSHKIYGSSEAVS